MSSYRTWGEALKLTHCGRCGKEEDILYWNEEYPLEDKANWLCIDCWEEYDEIALLDEVFGVQREDS